MTYPVLQSCAWLRTAVLLRQRWSPGADGRLDWWQHPGQGPRLGLTSVRGTTTGAGVLALALWCREFVLLLPLVWPVPHLPQPPAFHRMSQLQAPKGRWEHFAELLHAAAQTHKMVHTWTRSHSRPDSIIQVIWTRLFKSSSWFKCCTISSILNAKLLRSV